MKASHFFDREVIGARTVLVRTSRKRQGARRDSSRKQSCRHLLSPCYVE
jgi:hypothetical protein